MKTFLEYVAEDIIRKYGHDLSRIAIVFPNKRASLFINEHLARLAGRPIWSPSYITISDLFRSHSSLTVADPIKLVCDLHRSFVACTGIDETLDRFYGWGQLLLSDFDDIDKNMADADRVFANLRDIHELDDVSYLTDEQRDIIRQFFSNFSDEHNSTLKERFLKLWSHFADIYHDFNHRLAEQQLAYEGALYRQVADNEELSFEYDRYLFVGFNLLHKVEQRLFSRLKQEGKAFFYWDFDHYYMHQHEAGHFIAQYLSDYPNELDIHDDAIYRQFQQPKDITYISAPTENIQARYVSTWLKEHQRYTDGKRTAVLLCDEQLLPVVIHCLPTEVEKVNITTGYPLALTPAASLVNLLLTLQIGGYRPRLMAAIRRHPYYRYLDDELLKGCDTTGLFPTEAILQWIARLLRHIAQQAHVDKEENTDALREESLFRTYTLINRLAGLTNSGDLTVDLTTLQRLVTQLIRAASIPFHGEPAEGIQVMGILESRNLDFDHVLMLSCNEGNMPKGINDSSFIPHSLRKAYELTTVDHKTAIYAYYFHRILQRAKDVTLVYNNTADERHTGEMSRFMLQLMVESGHPITQFALKANSHQSSLINNHSPLTKTDAVMQVLLDRFTKKPDTQHALLTPTAINSYRRCPLRFFYRYVGGLKEPDDDEPQIDDRIFGLVFHAAAQHIYEQLMQRSHRIEKVQLQQLLESKTAIALAVDEAFRHELPDMKEYNGLQLINREVVIHYVRQLLQLDMRLTPFNVLALEHEVVDDWQVDNGQVSFTTTIGGSIDRLDAIDVDNDHERIRVIDYKTSAGQLDSIADVESIFTTNDSHNGYYLQTLLYSSIVRHNSKLNDSHLPVSPALLFIQHSAVDDYDPTLRFGDEKILDVEPYIADFKKDLKICINEIFNPEIAFTPTEDKKNCRYCPYAKLCGRG
ncbi:MAG: PD-(D/E)XK nuclease family protein [Prevotella sp.]|nr:PD-(D/E)XK nuclease family protein [Prevotella sp.]